jgi:hypothetical protein
MLPITLIDGSQVDGIVADEEWHYYTVTKKVPSGGSAFRVEIWTGVGTTSGDYLEIAQVQLELGKVATPFEHRSYGEELALCQRYYYKTYNQSVTPGTVTLSGASASITSTTSSTVHPHYFQFPVEMRSAPSITPYSISGTANRASTSGSFSTSSNTDQTISTSQGGTRAALVISYTTSFCQTHNHYIPLDPANRHYQEVLDAIIEQGADCFDGDIPEDLQAAADEKQFNQQLADYRVAVARLAQYIVADGREEVTEMQPTGEQVFNEETMEMEDVMHEVITVTAIEPVEPTVTRMVYSEDDPMAEPVEETIENPVITTDVAERAAAQATVDATPQPVKDAA